MVTATDRSDIGFLIKLSSRLGKMCAVRLHARNLAKGFEISNCDKVHLPTSGTGDTYWTKVIRWGWVCQGISTAGGALFPILVRSSPFVALEPGQEA
jgi:hypothetical protein